MCVPLISFQIPRQQARGIATVRYKRHHVAAGDPKKKRSHGGETLIQNVERARRAGGDYKCVSMPPSDAEEGIFFLLTVFCSCERCRHLRQFLTICCCYSFATAHPTRRHGIRSPAHHHHHPTGSCYPHITTIIMQFRTVRCLACHNTDSHYPRLSYNYNEIPYCSSVRSPSLSPFPYSRVPKCYL